LSNVDQNKYCLCKSKSYYNSSSQTCISQSTYNQSCTDSSQCLSVNLVCLSSKCLCLSTNYWNGTWCVEYKKYSESCSSVPCDPSDVNLVCGTPPHGTFQQICYCNTDYYYDEYMSKCNRFKRPTANCSSSHECITNAYCALDSYSTSYVCVCLPGYYYSNSLDTCTLSSTHNQACSSSSCDSLKSLQCINSVCVCEDEYYWNGSECQLTKVYNEACSTTPVDNCRASRNLFCNGANCACLAASPTYDPLTGYCS
jgi:hypothetical protein